MREYDWQDSVGTWISTTAHVLRKTLSQRLSQQKITLRQWEVLACLSKLKNCSQSQLAEYVGIESHTLTGILGRMERDGWIRRIHAEGDRRRYSIEVTDQGAEVWDSSIPVCHEVRSQAINGLTQDELQSMLKVCVKILTNLGDEADYLDVLEIRPAEKQVEPNSGSDAVIEVETKSPAKVPEIQSEGQGDGTSPIACAS